MSLIRIPDFQMIQDDIESQKRYIVNLQTQLKQSKTNLRNKEQTLKKLQKKYSPENRERLLAQIQKEYSKK
jgi:hypothetical protein